MVRTTEEASAIFLTVVALDGKTKLTYELRPPMATFFDVANTLDHGRNSGLEANEDARPVPPTRHRQVEKV